MAAILARLSVVVDIAVISGGDWPQFDKQVASRLPEGTDRSRFWLMPTTGTKLYRFEDGQWVRKYADLFSDEDRAHSRSSIIHCSNSWIIFKMALAVLLPPPPYTHGSFSRPRMQGSNRSSQSSRSCEPLLIALDSRPLRSGESRLRIAAARSLSQRLGKSLSHSQNNQHMVDLKSLQSPAASLLSPRENPPVLQHLLIASYTDNRPLSFQRKPGTLSKRSVA